MCTVTFIPVNEGVYITSNRDERYYRKQAIPPVHHIIDGATILYPEDADSGGSWIAVNSNGNTGVLLNGAFHRHTSRPPYKRSRGNVFLDLIKNEQPAENFSCMDLLGIEPFTVIILDDNHLYECRWDGSKKYCSKKDKYLPHIWSSSTLYDKDVADRRSRWFYEWQDKNPAPPGQDILHFHRFAGDGDAHNDLRMNREGIVFTVSVTSIALHNKGATMLYLDLKDDKTYLQEIDFIAAHSLKEIYS